MAIVPQQQGFPFVVEPLSPERVQFWASYAGQVFTQSGFNQVSYAFTAFWFEAQADKEYRYVQDTLQRGWEQNAVGWMDQLVSSLGHIVQMWSRVVQQMDESWGGQIPVSMELWYRDARNRVQSAGSLRQVVAGRVMEWCGQCQQPFPEHTRTFVQEMQG